jgi:putative NADPH-quinone reductase
MACNVRRLDVASLAFGWLDSQAEFERGTPPRAILYAQENARWAHHLVVIFPLWLGDVPAVLKAFFEQLLRPGFAFDYRPGGFPVKRLKGRSASVIVTMGMPRPGLSLVLRRSRCWAASPRGARTRSAAPWRT